MLTAKFQCKKSNKYNEGQKKNGEAKEENQGDEGRRIKREGI